MGFAPNYLVGRFFYRLFDFFHHWYFDASRAFFNYFVNLLENLDETLALGLTLRYFFHPLYRDYTIVGRILGVIFRSMRIVAGFLVYSAITAIFLVIYLFWLVIPPLLIFSATSGLSVTPNF